MGNKVHKDPLTWIKTSTSRSRWCQLHQEVLPGYVLHTLEKEMEISKGFREENKKQRGSGRKSDQHNIDRAVPIDIFHRPTCKNGEEEEDSLLSDSNDMVNYSLHRVFRHRIPRCQKKQPPMPNQISSSSIIGSEREGGGGGRWIRGPRYQESEEQGRGDSSEASKLWKTMAVAIPSVRIQCRLKWTLWRHVAR